MKILIVIGAICAIAIIWVVVVIIVAVIEFRKNPWGLK